MLLQMVFGSTERRQYWPDLARTSLAYSYSIAYNIMLELPETL